MATGLYGISFGALAVAAGLDRFQTQALSAIMFTGGSQFAFIGTLGSGGAAALAAASLLGVRNAVYGAQLNAVFSPKAVLRPLMAHLSIDGLPSLLASNVNRWGGLLAEELLEGAVVHTVDRAAIDQAARQGLRPGALKVTEGGVRVTLDPIRAQGA